jgi:hypothetical protein
MIIDDNKKQAPKSDPDEASRLNPAAPVGIDAGTLQQLVLTLVEQQKISAAREARLIKKEEEDEARRSLRNKKHGENDEAEQEQIRQKQARCRHLKGGKYRLKNATKDYAVFLHRFINNVPMIKCFLCKMKWYPWDTKEVLVRGDRTRKNHTGIGWAEALIMIEESSNKPSSSEMPPESLAKAPTFHDVEDTGSSLGRY